MAMSFYYAGSNTQISGVASSVIRTDRPNCIAWYYDAPNARLMLAANGRAGGFGSANPFVTNTRQLIFVYAYTPSIWYACGLCQGAFSPGEVAELTADPYKFLSPA
jgi:hypothetical protein